MARWSGGIATVCLAGVAVVLVPSAARAQSPRGYLGVGPLLSFTLPTLAGAPETLGLGVEASYMRFPDSFVLGYGAFTQFLVNDDGSVRGALGMQAAALGCGLEAGWTFRTGISGYEFTNGLHLGAFFSLFGVLAASVRGTVPFGSLETGPGYGAELGFVLTLKIPVRLYGRDALDGFSLVNTRQGRPLRAKRGRARTAPAVRTAAWARVT